MKDVQSKLQNYLCLDWKSKNVAYLLPSIYRIIKALLFRIFSRNNVENPCIKTTSVTELHCSGGFEKRQPIWGWVLNRSIEKQVQNLTFLPSGLPCYRHLSLLRGSYTGILSLSSWILSGMFFAGNPLTKGHIVYWSWGGKRMFLQSYVRQLTVPSAWMGASTVFLVTVRNTSNIRIPVFLVKSASLISLWDHTLLF